MNHCDGQKYNFENKIKLCGSKWKISNLRNKIIKKKKTIINLADQNKDSQT